jgi:hypothetical protein
MYFTVKNIPIYTSLHLGVIYEVRGSVRYTVCIAMSNVETTEFSLGGFFQISPLHNQPTLYKTCSIN